jgi:hypothetical protein
VSAAGQQLPLELEPADETAAMLAAIDVDRLRHDSDRRLVYAVRTWLDERGPKFTDAQRKAVARIYDERAR